jgi:hypothetical protein
LLGCEIHLSYLPPIMVYLAEGIAGITTIVGTFFVKDYLGLSASFLAALGFWAVFPWALKIPLGHLVDLLWRHKGLLVYLGAALIAASLLIMVLLIGNREAMTAFMPAEAWFVLSVLLAPVGFVLQDVVADAMTVEAVPRVFSDGRPIDSARRKQMNTTMQTLGRVASIGGSVLVAVINLYAFSGVEHLSTQQISVIYRNVYLTALVIPMISVAGVIAASVLRRRDMRRLIVHGCSREEATNLLSERGERTPPNWWILCGSLIFVGLTLVLGLSNMAYNQEIIFVCSFAIVAFLIKKLTGELEPEARAVLIGTACVVFMFRAVPAAGPGVTWWMIDELKFDQRFLSVLSLSGSGLTLAALFLFRRFMAKRSIGYVMGFLTICNFVLVAPIVGMYYGLHEWTSAWTGGMVDARFIALVDTSLETPLGQIALVPMLAWIANSAPSKLKATYFAVMASFVNLASSLSQLGTKYLNEAFVVTRQVAETAVGKVQVPADYSHLGSLLLAQLGLGLLLPFAAIIIARLAKATTA